MQNWANYIARVRRIRGLTQREAAALLEVSQATLSRWESGRQVPTPAERRRIQQRIETATGEARRLMEAMLRRSPLPVLLVDEKLEVVAASGPLLRLLGLPERCESEAELRERLFAADLPVLARLPSAPDERDLVGIDRVTEVVGPEGRRLPVRQLRVRFVCRLGEILYRIEVARLDPTEYGARLTAGRQLVVLRRSDLVGPGNLPADEPFVYGRAAQVPPAPAGKEGARGDPGPKWRRMQEKDVPLPNGTSCVP